MSTIQLAIKLGAESLKDAAQTMFFFPELNKPTENPLQTSGKLVGKAWNRVGYSLSEAMNVAARDSAHAFLPVEPNQAEQ